MTVQAGVELLHYLQTWLNTYLNALVTEKYFCFSPGYLEQLQNEISDSFPMLTLDFATILEKNKQYEEMIQLDRDPQHRDIRHNIPILLNFATNKDQQSWHLLYLCLLHYPQLMEYPPIHAIISDKLLDMPPEIKLILTSADGTELQKHLGISL